MTMDDNFVEAVKQAVAEGVGATPLERASGRYGQASDLLVFPLANGQHLATFDLGQYAPTPWRRSGNVSVNDADSLIEYVQRFGTLRSTTTIWGDRAKARVVAVLDDHQLDTVEGEQARLTGIPGWGDHRCTLNLRKDEDWLLWLAHDAKWLDQEDFADFLEQAAGTITPTEGVDQAAMYEIATSLRASKSADFKSAVNMANGEVRLGYEETVTARAGQQGQLEIPRSFRVQVPVYEGGTPLLIEALFRYRIINGNLKLGYRLVRPQAVERAAFTDVLNRIDLGTGLTVLAGAPREQRS